MKKDLWNLAIQGIKGRKSSSILLLTVLSLSFMVAVLSISVTESMNKTNEEYRYDTYGTWYGAIISGKEGDEAFLKESEWLDECGITKCYGVVSSGGNTVGIGTMDDTFREIGRIHLQDGAFPEKEDEIAMEASVLSGLGYDYELGQEITLDIGFRAGSEIVYARKTYTLCGVLKAYTQLWEKFSDGKTALNGAVVTEEAGETLLFLRDEIIDERNAQAVRESEENGTEIADLLTPDEIVPRYYFTVKPGREEEMKQQVNEYLSETRNAPVSVLVNEMAYSGQSAAYSYTYVTLTYVVTLLAVFCIYTIQMQRQVRQIALFRSIGITRRQLRRMSLYETLCISIPAAMNGIIAGSIGIRLVLKLLVYAGSVDIKVSIPFRILLPVLLLWMTGIALVRITVLRLAVRQPLTGRMTMSRSKEKRISILKKIEILLLMSLFCGTIFFTVMESGIHFRLMVYWKNAACYIIKERGGLMYGTPEDVSSLSKDRMELYRQIPGIDWINGYSRADVKMDFEGMENSLFYQTYKEQSDLGVYHWLYTVPEEKWDDFFGKDMDEPDMEAFRKGEVVFLSFPVDSEEKYILDSSGSGTQFEETGIESGENIKLTFVGSKIQDGILQDEKEIYSITARVGRILRYKDGEVNGVNSMLCQPYTILCSEEFLKTIISRMEPGYVCSSNYFTGEEDVGYTYIYGTADLNAGYLSTDYVLAQLCQEDGLILDNYREVYLTSVQEHLQTLLLLLFSGMGIVIVLLLIVGNLLFMETYAEQRKYGILQAIGMSGRQMKGEIFKKSLFYSIPAMAAGWGIYGCYLLWNVVRVSRENMEEGIQLSLLEEFKNKIMYLYADGRTMWGLTVGAVLMLSFVWYLTKRSLFRKELIEKIQDQN